MKRVGRKCTAILLATMLSLSNLSPALGQSISFVNAEEAVVSTATDAISVEEIVISETEEIESEEISEVQATEETSEVSEVKEGGEAEAVVSEDAAEETEVVESATEVEIAMPPQKFEAKSVSGITVKASAKEGIFPAGTVMKAMDVSAAKTDELTAKLDEEALDAVAVDISFYNKDGVEIEPANGQKVDVEIKLPAQKKMDGDNFEVLHYDEKANVLEEVANANANGEAAEFKSGEFSIYIVTSIGDFDKDKYTYKTYGTNPQWNAEIFIYDWSTPYILRLGESVTVYGYKNIGDKSTFYLKDAEDCLSIASPVEEDLRYT